MWEKNTLLGAFLLCVPANVWNMESLSSDETQNELLSGKLLQITSIVRDTFKILVQNI